MKIKPILLLLIAFSCSSHSETLDSFFASRPDLRGNIEARTAIKEMASEIASSEAINEGSESPGARGAKLMRENGGDYAQLAIKKLASGCKGDSYVYDTMGMSKEACDLIVAYSMPKAEQQQIENGKEILESLINAITKSCILTGQGKDKEALSAINNAVFPGGEPNPIKMTQKQFDGLKQYFLQYRNLDEDHCSEYAKDFVLSSAQQQ